VNEDRISFREALVRAAIPLAALAALAALASYEADPVGAAETAYLAVLATAGLLAVAFLAPAPAWEAGIGAALATAVVWALPPGPGRGAAVVLVLVGALAVAAARGAAVLSSFRSFTSFTSFWSLLPLALGLQVLLRGSELLFQPQASLRTLVALLALPAAGAAATAMLAQRHGPAALVAAGSALLLAPGWNVAVTAGLAALAAGDRIARWRGAILAAAAVGGTFLLMPRAADPSMAAGPLALAVLYLGRKILAFPAVAIASLLAAVALLASYPWLRLDPLQEALGFFGLALTPLSAVILAAAFGILAAAGTWLRLSSAVLAAGALFLAACFHIPPPGKPLLPPEAAVVLDPAHPSWTSALDGGSTQTIVLDSSLSNGAVLANGTPVATVRLRDQKGRISEWTLRAGMETGEWAARRPDVVASSVLRSPSPWISWVAGDFFGQRYRARWTIDAPGPFTMLSVERNPALPPQVSLALHWMEARK
jgi:hypothetical protein